MAGDWGSQKTVNSECLATAAQSPQRARTMCSQCFTGLATLQLNRMLFLILWDKNENEKTKTTPKLVSIIKNEIGWLLIKKAAI